MKYCISSRQLRSVLQQADEIKVSWNDRDVIFDLIEGFSDKAIILDMPKFEPEYVDWKMYEDKFAKFYVALHDLSHYEELNEHGVHWFWPYEVTSYYELQQLRELGPSYLNLGPPLSFDLAKVQKIADGIPLRMTANIARFVYLPAKNDFSSICGQWIRPEDVSAYGEYITTLEFDTAALEKEAALMKIYQRGSWPGNLNLLLKDFNIDVDNSLLDENLIRRRLNCGQRCAYEGSCSACYQAIKLARLLDGIEQIDSDKKI